MKGFNSYVFTCAFERNINSSSSSISNSMMWWKQYQIWIAQTNTVDFMNAPNTQCNKSGECIVLVAVRIQVRKRWQMHHAWLTVLAQTRCNEWLMFSPHTRLRIDSDWAKNTIQRHWRMGSLRWSGGHAHIACKYWSERLSCTLLLFVSIIVFI